MYSVCTVLLNWNGCEDTLECCDSLIASQPPPDAVVICDNGSTDNSPAVIVERLRRIYGYQFVPSKGKRLEADNRRPSVILIENGINRGFAAGNNPGIRYALEHGFEFIWLLNNDTAVYEDSLKHLLECASISPATGIRGSTVVYDHRPDKIQCAGGCTYNPLTTVFQPAYQGFPLNCIQSSPEPSLDYIYGASMFVNRQVFEKAGLLNERFFLFYEELDLCRRACRHGFDMGWCRPSIVRHKQGKSVSRIQQDGRGQIIAYHETLSTLIFTAIHYPFLLPVTLSLRFAGKLSAVLKRGETHLVRPLMKAYKDFFRMLVRSGYGHKTVDPQAYPGSVLFRNDTEPPNPEP